MARAAASAVGVTRLADVTGLDTLGIPVFQAIRPLARSLSVSQGKGLTPMAAMVSALLEATELAVAEALPPPSRVPLIAHDAATIALWSTAARPDLGIGLDPNYPRGWLTAHDARTGAPLLAPWDITAMDYTRVASPDVRTTSAGLASGNSPTEALVGAIAELVEHAVDAEWGDAPPAAKQATGIDLASIDVPIVRRLLARIVAGGCTPRIWSMGQDAGIAVFRCALVESAGADTALVPAIGTGAHPDRITALVRAIVEAAQTRATLIAGARDDLEYDHYRHRGERTFTLMFATLGFGAGPLPWPAVPDHATATAAADLTCLLDAVARRTPLPIAVIDLPSPIPGLAVVRALAPGLADADRMREPARPAAVIAPVVRRAGLPVSVVFAGPSLPPGPLPPGIERRDPAKCGDLAALLADPPRAVGLIDGCFETAPTVWHKEILDLIAHGIPVFGAASLGAIRAAELHNLGMVGIGRIFAAYRDGAIRRDDAVMVRHAPAALGHRSLTVALVDAEAALDAVDLDPQARRMLQRIVRTTPFRQRDWARCLAQFVVRTGVSAPITVGELAAVSTVKEADARLLIAALTTAEARSPGARPPMTGYYRRLLNRLPAPA